MKQNKFRVFLLYFIAMMMGGMHQVPLWYLLIIFASVVMLYLLPNYEQFPVRFKFRLGRSRMHKSISIYTDKKERIIKFNPFCIHTIHAA